VIIIDLESLPPQRWHAYVLENSLAKE
jgi:hypothetical protein